ncbi:MAG: hypothetical protein AB8H47_28845 [Bacteroidia bacterium]
MKELMKAVWFLTLISLGLLSACSTASPYEKLVEAELDKNVRNDSLFLGLTMGMDKKGFYEACWELNKQGLVRQGSGNESVRYELDELPHKATLNFYPKFEDEKVIAMPCVFVYEGWAPWNEELFGSKMALDIQKMFMDWYGGNEFIEIIDPTKGLAYYKIDGNRQITMLPQDELVRVLIKDLTVESNRNPVRLKIPENKPKNPVNRDSL